MAMKDFSSTDDIEGANKSDSIFDDNFEVQMVIRCSRATRQELKDIAHANRINLTDMIRDAIDAHIKTLR